MKIAVLTYGDLGGSYQTAPRGTYAYIHFLEQFGHRVIHADCAGWRLSWAMLRMLRREKPDVVVGQHGGAMLAAVWRRTGLIACPVVHAWDDYYAEQSLLPAWFVWPLEKLSVTGADHITSVSRYNVHLAERWGKPATFIPHGVTPDQRPGPMVLESPRLKVVYLGDQSLYKGMTKLMEAMRGAEAELFMVGTVNPALQSLAPANVRFMGRIPPEEVLSVLSQADVLVNPSDQDSNFKLQEYIRAGKPILGVTGRMEWAFEHGRTAWICSDLAEGLARLAADPALRERLAAGARSLSYLTWEQTVRRLEAVLLAVAESARRP
jgi:glycosyltransferase involved in cell wall biosynthesis